MEFFVPAWHKQYDDWSISIPSIDGLDATSHMRLLKNHNHQIGLIVTDYQPQLTTRLNQSSYYPDKIFSVYDYLQGIKGLENKVVKLDDFNWPRNAIYDFSPFRTLVVVNKKLLATVFYDLEGKILRIDYAASDDKSSYSLLMDSRGFVSSMTNDQERIYFDPYGNWRFKVDQNSEVVTINPRLHISKKSRYGNVTELLTEVITTYLAQEITDDDHLIVTLDDQATIAEKSFESYRPIYLISKNHPYKNKLKSLKHNVVVISQAELTDQVENIKGKDLDIHIIPTYNSEFRLGHSSREAVQHIAFFAENASKDEIDEIVPELCSYLSKDYRNKSLKIFTYSLEKNNWVNEIISKIKAEKKGQMVIREDSTKVENSEIEGLGKNNQIPVINLKSDRITDLSQLLKALDRIRVLINWGKPDELMEIAAISIGIPQIQNFASATVIDRKNGYLCQNVSEIEQALDNYLLGLNEWNKAAVYNVKMLNRYSEDNIVKKWEKVLGENK